jgi:6-phosphogluconolactonase
MEEAGMANNYFDFITFESREDLVESLSKKIVESLSKVLETREYASLALSGGSTPVKLLNRLSKAELKWENVRVTLVDERWVDASSQSSNEKLIRDNLLINSAKEAKFFPLKSSATSAKDGVKTLELQLKEFAPLLDVVVLGMGSDGHSASFFPKTKELEDALSTEALLCATTATAEPKERITLSRSFLLSAQNLFLHIEGKEKKRVFENAAKSDSVSEMPIISMMQQKIPLLEVYYAD